MEIFEIFANQLKTLRQEKGLSRKQLSEQANVPVHIIASCEQGKNIRKIRYLLNFADFFGVTLEKLLHGKESDKVKRI